MGIAHFLALRWIIWPAEGENGQARQPQSAHSSIPDDVVIPDAVFDAVVAFIARGLSPD